MVLISVKFDVSVYYGHVSYYAYVAVDTNRARFRINNTPALAQLLNRHATKITISESGLGYDAEVPENVAPALEYIAYVKTSKEDLDEIVATGTTKIHRFASELGLNVEGRGVEAILKSNVNCQGFELHLSNFPTLLLTSEPQKVIKFRAEGTENFLKRLTHDEATEDEVQMLIGISLLGEGTQSKYVRLLSSGQLTKDALARAMCRSALSSRNGSYSFHPDRTSWKRIVEWLKNNGYGKESSEIIVKRTLCSG